MSEERGPAPRDLRPVVRAQLFLPKDSYRARRAVDAIKLWPVLGLICFTLPIIWTGAGKSNVGAMGYIFSVWVVLVVGGAFLTRRLGPEAESEPHAEGKLEVQDRVDGSP